MSRLIAIAVTIAGLIAFIGVAIGDDVGRAEVARATSEFRAAAPETFEGRIVLVTKALLTIVAKNGDNLMFMVAADCKVTKDGKPSSVDMLGAGDRVMIAASSEADRKIANAITARAPERAPSMIASK